MADSNAPELAAALLKWVQAFQTSREVVDWKDLQDGRMLWEILRDIDPTYFEGDLPEPLQKTEDHWIPRWQNLKHINRLVTAYLRDSSNSLENPSSNLVPDLKAIATDASTRDTVTLLKIILRAAMYSPESNERMGRLIVSLGPEAAMNIAAAMKQMDDDDMEAETQSLEPDEEPELDSSPERGPSATLMSALSSPPPAGRSSVERDPELEQEEKLIRAYKAIKELQASNEKAATELEELRQDKEELQQAFDAFKYEVEQEGRNAAEHNIVKELQNKVDRDRDYIAELESELDATRTTSSNQQRQIERYKADTDVKQKLRDDLQLLRSERDELLQKSRASENLKKKIQTLQDQEKSNATLKEDLKLANEQLQDLDKLRDQCAALQKANAENLKLIANGEQEIFDQKTSKKRLEHEYKVLAQKWEVAKERQGRDHETITDLENKLQSLEFTPSGVHGSRNDLNGELDQENARTNDASIKAPNAAMQSADASILQQKLDAINARNTKLENEYLEILQDKLGLETAIQDLREPSREPEENIPFLEQRKKLQATQAELAKLRNHGFTLTAELASVKDKLLAAEHDQGTRSLDSNTEYQSLTARYAELQKHSEGVESELAEQRALLRHALLNASALSKEPADIRSTHEYKLIFQQLQAVQEAPPESDVLEHTATSLAARVETSRAEGLAANKRVEEQDAEITLLKSQVSTSAQAGSKAQIPSKEYEALQRENRLISSAWFDLSSRIQNNTVMVGRRKETPKGFLGKQRAIVTPLVAGGQHRR